MLFLFSLSLLLLICCIFLILGKKVSFFYSVSSFWIYRKERKREMYGERNGVKAKVTSQSRKHIDVDGLRRPPNNQGEKDDLYVKLWHACAGPSVYAPRAGEKVFYFPQGHMEQVEAYMNKDGTMEMPIYNLPSKILCRVVHVQLKAETGTDEVFAQITLLPEAEQDELSMEHRNYQALPREAHPRILSKKLTPSDTNTHGGFSVPKRHADDGCLPPLDMSQHTPQQDLVAIDLHGSEWRFRHIFRGQPKRHLLTSGWSTFVTSKKLVAGDTFIFLRGDNGELHVGVHRATTLMNNTSTSVISGHSMRHGILASAFHAFSTRSMFTIYYRPWTSSSEFIIPLDQYMKSAEIVYSIGTRFRMQSEGKECGEQRALGTIIGTEDVDHIRWPNSEWRCLKVKLDPTSDANFRPERVCPWNIEPIESTNRKKPFILRQQKRARTDDASSPGFSSLLMDGMWCGSVKYESQSSSGVLQGQEDDTDVNQSSALRQPLPHLVLPLHPDCASMQPQMENQLEIQVPICNSFYQCTSSRALYSGGKVACLGLHNNWSPTFSSYGVDDDALARRKFSVPYVNSQESRTLELRNENETSLCEPTGGHRCMIFGVNLVNGPPELPSRQVLTSSELKRLCSIPPTSQSSVSEPSKVTSSKQCNNSCSVSNRSCTKVLKYGTALGRSVDLTRFNGYENLISELDRMFDFKGRLINGSSGWHVTYTDDEGDMMLLGDYPWQKFQYEVRRIVICPMEEIDRLNQSSPNSTSQ
ncbi:PREDICTED: auxin response factor 4 isoform X1 [Theobroma cacao]|uniref:Auxin response factor n=1 Tax=Theobroma cacao TaxID=3641 RepID=A0AB32VPP2_THECC|nr:PREDICTED: auxin response factor 4 isoform X1 [Theobroma cacao]